MLRSSKFKKFICWIWENYCQIFFKELEWKICKSWLYFWQINLYVAFVEPFIDINRYVIYVIWTEIYYFVLLVFRFKIIELYFSAKRSKIFERVTNFIVNMKIYLLSNKGNIFNKQLTNIFVELKMRKWSMNKYQIWSLKRRFYLSQEFWKFFVVDSWKIFVEWKKKFFLCIRPIEIQIRYEAALTAKRLEVMGEWINRDHKSYHRQIIWETIGHSTGVSDRIPDTQIATKCETLIPDRQSWTDGTLEQMPSGTCCYTDGSKLGEKTGLGFFIEEPDTEFSFPLPDHNLDFQADARAIIESVSWFRANTRPTNVNIFTDSQIDNWTQLRLKQ